MDAGESLASSAVSEPPQSESRTPPSPSKLTAELSRRFTPVLPQNLPAKRADDLPELYLCEPRHDEASAPSVSPLEGNTEGGQGEGLVSKWRQKERLKTTAVALVVCLNIGVDPPDVIKISPCARLECWVDPLSMQAPKALDTIGKNLQAQYERWQPRAKYKMHLDPTSEDVKKLAISCRRNSKNERVLFHYNGHGVPRPTSNGEIWVFNKSYTQYIPLSIYDLQTWVGTPAIYVFDCSAAGQVLNSFKQFMFQRQQEAEGYTPGQVYPHALSQSAASLSGASSSAALVERPDPMRECILLCACSDREVLPQTPDLPADVFTSCLTTPIKVALRWFCSQSLLRHEGVTKELIDRIPGKQSDRKTPLGELNWIFTAITDTIAWNVLPRALFQKLFRQDLLVASLFRNFLLAERIMRGANCTPCAYPRLPPTHQHPMWQAWDMAAEMCLLQLPNLLSGEAGAEYHPSPFFAQQLTAFELWLEHGSPDKKPPEQLPIVLQVLLSQVHRLRALVLLGRFLDMGSWAVDLALSVGIFPYVLKLLQTTATDLRQTLVFIWAKIMAWDANAQVQSDLVKDGGQAYFMRHLESPDPSLPPSSRAQAAFVLASICSSHPKGQMLCAQGGLLQVCLNQLTPTLVMLRQAQSEHAAADVRSTAQLVKWLLLCLGKLWEGAAAITGLALRDQVQEQVAKLLCEDDAEIRAAAVFALGALIQAQEGDPPPGGAASPSPLPLGDGQPPRPPLTDQERMAVERAIACVLLEVVYDASPAVRCEVATSLARVAVGHTLLFQDAVHAHQRTSARIMRSSSQGRGLGQQHTDTSRSAPEGPATSANSSVGLPAGASAPPQQVAQPQKNGQATSADNAHSKGAAGTLPRSVARISSDDQIPSGGSPTSSASPGVRLRYDQAYEPVLHIGLEEAQLGGVFASADAARVGGGLYLAVVEALCTLATDPSPRVCAAGLAALRAANVELVELAPAGGGKHGAGTSHTPPAGSSSTPSSPPAAALTTTSTASTSSFLPRSWQAKAWRSGGSAPNPPRSQTPTPASSTGGGSVHSSPTASPSGSVKGGSCTTRAAFILRRTPDRGDQSHYQPGLQQRAHPHLHPSPPTASLSRQTSSQSVASTSGGYELLPPSAQHSAASLPTLSEAEGGRRSSAGGGKAEAIPSGAVALPRSAIYRSSCQRFTWPLLTQQGGRACELEGWGLHAPWATPPDPEKLLQRHRKREEDVARCAAVAADPKRARLRDTVLTVDTGSDRNTAIMMDPFKPLVTSVDGQGVVRVSNYLQRATVNRFHVVTGGPPYDPSSGQRCTYPPVSVTALFQLNEMHSSQLLTCAADGAVRVWRDYGARKGQRLASAWQAVLVSSQGTPSRPAVFEWSLQQGTLFAAGGRLSGRVYLWDVDREVCGGQLNCGAGGSTGGGGGEGAADAAALDHLCCSRTSPTLLAADCTGTVRIFDLRTNGVAGATQHLRGKLAGLVMEPGGREHQVVLGYPGGQLAFLDCRVMGGGSSNRGGEGGSGRVECGVWKTVEAHSKGPMTTLVCHHHAPLLATATAHQVVKVWSAGGEQVGVVRAHTSFLSQRIGPITCMAFSPYDLMLASGGVDPLVAVYCVEGKGGAGGGAQRSAPPSPVQQLPPPQQLLLPPPPAAAPPHGRRGPAHRASASSG